MDQRKLIKFGRTAHCITLPQTWIRKNELKKGDNLGVQETLRGSLEIIPGVDEREDTSSLSIDIAGKSTDEIVHLLLATYLNGYNIITLRGKNSGKVAYIRKHVHDFIAAEIMEVTAEKITIHIFWDIEGIDLHAILNRIGHIIHNILGETVGMLYGRIDAQDIRERGQEVQRQVLLAKRAITYALSHSSAAQKFNMSSLELYYVSYIIYFFGMMAEYIVELSLVLETALKEKLISPRSKIKVTALLERTADYYKKVVENYNKKGDHSRFVISEFQDFEKAINGFRKPEKNRVRQSWVLLAAEYIKMIIMKIKSTEFVIINLENSPKVASREL